MVRPKKQRICRFRPAFEQFHPAGLPDRQTVQIGCDELEAIRLTDLRGLSQEEAARSMRVARSTVADILESAHRKIAKALIEGCMLEVITPDNCTFESEQTDQEKPLTLPSLTQTKLHEELMRIAIPVENNVICQHFGKAPAFRIYDIDNNQIVNIFSLESVGNGHDAIATQLGTAQVNVVICGGMGSGAQQALSELGIQIIGGASGAPDDLIGAYLDYLEGSAGGCGCGCGGSEPSGGCGCGCGGHGETSGSGCCCH